MGNRKNFFTLSVLSFLSLIYLVIIWGGLNQQNIRIEETLELKGVVTNKGIDNHIGTKHKKTKCFFIKLNNLDHKVGVKRWFKGYDDLINTVNIGDTVTINYFDKYKPDENINIDLVQLKKQEVILLGKNEYEKGKMVYVYVCIFALIINFFLFYKTIKRKP